MSGPRMDSFETTPGFVAVVLKGYPRLSETFIAREILGLEERGLDLRLFSLREPHDPAIHPVHEQIQAPVAYLPEYLKDDPARVFRAWRLARRWPSYQTARQAWLRDLKRDRSANRIRRFGQALVLAAELDADCRHIHAHFLHTPASVARYAALMRRLPFSVSAHAKDVWTTPDWDRQEKLESCRFAATCTAEAADNLSALAPEGVVQLLRHGLSETYCNRAPERPMRDGFNPADPVTILSVGRAVAKKGYDDLLKALAQLPPDLHWRFVHIGAGDELDRLKADAEALGLSNQITWLGARSEDEVAGHYASADLFALASRVTESGDRDGIPNVLMEAQATGLACVATTAGGIPELIIHDETGLLVPPGDVDTLTEALTRAITEPDLRTRLGKTGRARMRKAFSAEPTLDALAELLGAPEPHAISSSVSLSLAKAG